MFLEGTDGYSTYVNPDNISYVEFVSKQHLVVHFFGGGELKLYGAEAAKFEDMLQEHETLKIVNRYNRGVGNV